MAPPFPIPLLPAPPAVSLPLFATRSRRQANPVGQAAVVQIGRTKLSSPPVQLWGERRDDTDPTGRAVCVVDPSLLVDVQGVIDCSRV